jgi:hypothetical protein
VSLVKQSHAIQRSSVRVANQIVDEVVAWGRVCRGRRPNNRATFEVLEGSEQLGSRHPHDALEHIESEAPSQSGRPWEQFGSARAQLVEPGLQELIERLGDRALSRRDGASDFECEEGVSSTLGEYPVRVAGRRESQHDAPDRRRVERREYDLPGSALTLERTPQAKGRPIVRQVTRASRADDDA